MRKRSLDLTVLLLLLAVGLQAWLMFSRDLGDRLQEGREHEKILLQGKTQVPASPQLPGLGEGYGQGAAWPDNRASNRGAVPERGPIPGAPLQGPRPPLRVDRENVYHFWLAGIVLLEQDGRYPLTPLQARRLLKFVRSIEDVTGQARETVTRNLTPEQKRFIQDMVYQRRMRDESPLSRAQVKALLHRVLERLHAEK